MANLNKVFLIGNLTRDPEVRYTSGGAAVANFSMAVNERYRTAAGEDKVDTCFVDLEVWGKQAETLKQYVRKGDPLFVEGRLRMETWQDKATGQNRSRMRIRCDRFQFLARGNAGQGGGNFGGQPQQYGQPQQASQGGGYQQPQAPQQFQ
jgi:single-strand DNA-binding protein